MQNNKTYTIGIDIGGTNMKAVLFDGQDVIADYSLATPKDSLNHFFIMIKALSEPLIDKAKKDKMKIKGIGLGIAGVHDYKEEKILKSPNIPLLDGVKLKEQLENKTKLPIKMDNDTNCFLRAEVRLGEAKKYKNIFGLIIGTGIGGAWWINDDIYLGSHGGAGEPGRMITNYTEPIDLEEVYQKLTQGNPAHLAQEAYKGDELAQKSYKEIGNYLGIALANIVNLIDPEAIIIGGGVIESSDLFMSEMKKTMKNYIMSSEAKKVKILKSKLGVQTGAIGAALLIE
ncbi:MAG: ROK family protein [Patescibacteria group bacterium]